MTVFRKFWSFLRRVMGYVLMPVRRNAVFFCFMWVLGALCTLFTANPNPNHIRYPYPLVELTLDLYVLCLLLLAVPRRAKKWVRGTLAVILYAIAVVDVWCFVMFHSRITPTMLLLIGETTGSEAGEFLGSYLSFDIVTSKVVWILLLAAAHIIVAVYHKSLRRWITACWAKIPVRSVITVLSGASLTALLIYAVSSTQKNKEIQWKIVESTTIGGVERALLRTSQEDVMYLPIYRLFFSMKANRLIAKQLDILIKTQERATVDSCTFTSPHIVLIIGESYNKHHASLYGYDKNTTPEQQKLEQTGRLIPFTDAVAPWNLTSFVFKLMFSTYIVNLNDKHDWCDTPLFPTLFRKAGYEVDFLTNQFLPQSHDAIYDFSGGFFLNNMTLSQSMFSHRNKRLHNLDNGILLDYDSLAATRINDTTPRLTIFHLMGQHVEYHHRYPRNRAYFHANHYERPDLGRREMKWLVDYDNATRYNDSITAQIVKRFEDKETIIIFLADHGEEVCDPIVKKHGRIHSDNIDTRMAHEEYEIPMWIYCTPTYIKRHPDIFQNIKQCSSRPFMSDALPHMLLYLAGIQTKHYQPQYNILAPEYNTSRPRYMKKRIDYNKLDMSKYHTNEYTTLRK